MFAGAVINVTPKNSAYLLLYGERDVLCGSYGTDIRNALKIIQRLSAFFHLRAKKIRLLDFGVTNVGFYEQNTRCLQPSRQRGG